MHNSLDLVDRDLLRRKYVIPAIAEIPGKPLTTNNPQPLN